MGWKDRFKYNGKSVVEHEVNGNILRFYPNRMRLLDELAEISKPLGKAVATLFTDGRDAASSNESQREKMRKDAAGVETADFAVDKITMQAISPELAKYRREERDAAIDELLDGLTNTRNQLLLGQLLMDSLRDEFPYKKDRPVAEVEEFLFGSDKDADQYQGLDAPMIVELVQGWLKANAKVFGASGEKMVALVRGRLGALQGRSPLEATTSTTDGSSSKTPSPEPSPSDSPSTTSSDSTSSSSTPS